MESRDDRAIGPSAHLASLAPDPTVRPSRFAIDSPKSATGWIFHLLELTAYSRQPTVGGNVQRSPPPIAFRFLPAAYPFRPSDPDARILSCGLRRLNGLGFE